MLRSPRRAVPLLLAPVVFVLAACGGGHGSSPPPVGAAELTATPAVAHPGLRVVLRPRFAAGVARIDPAIGPVVSGGSYEAPALNADTEFTLTIDRGGVIETRALTVPLRYRERVTVLPPSANTRTRAGSAPLADGRVLLVGGASSGPLYWSNTEAVAPGGQFAPVGELSTGRAESTVVPLPTGGALTFGGVVNVSDFALSTLVEEWDPAAGAWSVRGNTACNRIRHTATLFADGRVLLAGGVAIGPVSERDAELWVPGVGARAPANEMVRRRAAHTATRMQDGRILLIGGYDVGGGGAIVQCEWFDPVTETFAPGPELGTARFHHAAVPLLDGRVLVIGGERDGIDVLATAEVFDPASGTFAPGGAMVAARTEVRAVRLFGGDVLVAGGATDVLANDGIEVWSPATGQFREWTARLPARSTGHALHRLPDGRVLLLGGDVGDGWPAAVCWVLD